MTFYDYITEFTRVYRENMDAPAALREARCLAVQSRYEFAPMEPEDLLAGRKRVVPVGFSNEPCWAAAFAGSMTSSAPWKLWNGKAPHRLRSGR